MNTTKTLALAAVAALSLGVGSAMAQSNTVAPNTYAAPAPTAQQMQAPAMRSQEGTVQYGSSDHNGPTEGNGGVDLIQGGF